VERRFRLNKDSDFKRVRQFGRTYSHPLLVLIVHSNEFKISRVGIIAGKSLGNAIKRNRIKRQIRACMASMLPQFQGSWDIVLIPRLAISGCDFSTIKDSLNDVFRRSGLMGKNE
jgi:ribonuclease P protein component